MRAVTIVVLTLLVAASALANRYGNASYLKPFPASEVKNAYQFSGNDQFQHAVPYASAALRYAAIATAKELGPGIVPPVVCDASTKTGDTPAGRHPVGAHDGGINLDVTYYMRRLAAGYIVCPQNANAHCIGPATDLDAKRQAAFFNYLAALDASYDGKLVQRVAVDWQVWVAVHPHLSVPAKRIVYAEETDLGTGWFRYHHNHFHARFYWNPKQSHQWAAEIEAQVARRVGETK